MSDSEYSVIKNDVIKRFDCLSYFISTVVNPITSDILFDETTLINPKRRKMTFTAFQPEELPKEGDIIGLDAEFVSLNQVSVYLGKSTTIRESNHGSGVCKQHYV